MFDPKKLNSLRTKTLTHLTICAISLLATASFRIQPGQLNIYKLSLILVAIASGSRAIVLGDQFNKEQRKYLLSEQMKTDILAAQATNQVSAQIELDRAKAAQQLEKQLSQN